MKYLAILALLIAGCGTVTCDCGDGRTMKQTLVSQEQTAVLSCVAFCGNQKAPK